MIAFKHKIIKKKKGDFYQTPVPNYLSFLDFPEQTIRYFNEAEYLFSQGFNVLYDLSEVDYIGCDAIGMLISQIKDRKINRGRLILVINPISKKCNERFKKWTIFKKVQEDYKYTPDDSESLTKVTNLIVTNEVAKELCVATSAYLNDGVIIRIKELYECLIELMANTGDHASGDKDTEYKWWLYFSIHEEIISFIFLDTGIGIFESLPVKQKILKYDINEDPLNADEKKRAFRKSEIEKVFDDLTNGLIKSSTGLGIRGKGIPLIDKHSKNNMFDRFHLIANDVYIDMKKNQVSIMDEYFSGTMVCFLVKKKS